MEELMCLTETDLNANRLQVQYIFSLLNASYND